MNKWSLEELKILVNNYKTLGPKKCGILLNRTSGACETKASKLGLTFNRSEKWNYDVLIEVTKNAKNKTECLIKLKLSPKSSGNYKTFSKYIKLYKIDISHFTETKYNLNKRVNFNEIPIDEVLVENSTYTNTSSLKAKLYKYGLKQRQCELCTQGEIWKGNKMSLILDHINGINDDNRLENLRILCPNCNATLDTHCKGAKGILQKEDN